MKYFLFQAGCGWWEGEADLVRVAPLNESELTSQLAERLSGGLHLTRAGQHCLLSISPLGGRKEEAEDDEELLLQQVEEVYQRALHSRENQSIVLTGRSGSGKTCNYRRALQYLVEAEGNQQSALSGMYCVYIVF